jgi:hypothetical protein
MNYEHICNMMGMRNKASAVKDDLEIDTLKN